MRSSHSAKAAWRDRVVPTNVAASSGGEDPALLLIEQRLTVAVARPAPLRSGYVDGLNPRGARAQRGSIASPASISPLLQQLQTPW